MSRIALCNIPTFSYIGGMHSTPPLFHRDSIRAKRARAAMSPALFLHQQSAHELQERLQEVNRRFTSPAIISPWPSIWTDILPDAKIIEDNEVLELEAGAHDLVIHALCLHSANDPVGQLVQCRRALCEDGLFLATLFGGETLRELRSSLATAESRLKGGLSPRVSPMGEIRDLGGLLQRAGFALPVADNAQFQVTYESAMALMSDLRAMGETNALAARQKSFSSRKLMFDAAEIYSNSFGHPDGRIPATFDIVTLTGWAPSPDQPKPLRPGSAQQRLADVLATVERPLDSSDD